MCVLIMKRMGINEGAAFSSQDMCVVVLHMIRKMIFFHVNHIFLKIFVEVFFEPGLVFGLKLLEI